MNWLVQLNAGSILDAPNRKFHLGCFGETCTVQSWINSDAGSGTFLHLWYSLDDRRQVLSAFNIFRYRIATGKFPNVYSCLTKGAIEQTGADLTKVHWANLNSVVEAEVCLWRIASAAGSSKVTRAWLEEVGFRPKLTHYPFGHYKYGQSNIYARWRGKTGFPLKSFSFWFRRTMSFTFGLSMEFNSDDTPINVQLNYSIL